MNSIEVDSVNYAVADPAGSAPFAFTGTDLVVGLNRRNPWVFLSEVGFADAARNAGRIGVVGLQLTWPQCFALAGRQCRRESETTACLPTLDRHL